MEVPWNLPMFLQRLRGRKPLVQEFVEVEGGREVELENKILRMNCSICTCGHWYTTSLLTQFILKSSLGTRMSLL